MKIIHFDKTVSTNEYLKRLKNPTEDAVVIADEQTGGRGSKGRSFCSAFGGCYLSALKLYPEKAENCFKIMENAAVAVCKTLDAFGVHAMIKWPNDIFVGDKKICGILIENTLSGDMVSRSIIGIGVNVNNDLTGIEGIATSVKILTGKEISLDAFRFTLIHNLFLPVDEAEYKKRSLVVGKTLTIKKSDGSLFKAKAVAVAENGNLILDDGVQLSAAEVSVL